MKAVAVCPDGKELCLLPSGLRRPTEYFTPFTAALITATDRASEVSILPHELRLSQRRQLTMTGVTEVVSFDEETVVLRTEMGTLVVRGSQLQLKALSPEGVAVEGTVSALIYEEPRSGGWRQLFG